MLSARVRIKFTLFLQPLEDLVNHGHRIGVSRDRKTALLDQGPNLHRLKELGGLSLHNLPYLVRYAEIALNLFGNRLGKNTPVDSMHGPDRVHESLNLFIYNLLTFIDFSLLYKSGFKLCNEVCEQRISKAHL